MVAKLAQITEGPAPSTFVIAAVVAMNYGPAKQFLKERGWSAAEIDALPAVRQCCSTKRPPTTASTTKC